MKKKILIVCANYYKDISIGLITSATKVLPKNFNVSMINVPGVFEIPVTISKNLKKFDAFIALGCVIKGETPHFELISHATTNAIMKLTIQTKKPIGNGIITCLNKKQALERSSLSITSSKINKGIESSKAVISVLSNVPKKL